MTENSNQNDEPKNKSSSSLPPHPLSSLPPSTPSTLESSSSSSNNTSSSSSSPSVSLVLLGKTLADASDWINDNLITVRYSVMATIGLLTLYGVSQTPLFFRYVKISEIPTSMFVKQKSLSCRLIQIQHHQQQESSSRILKQHSGGYSGKPRQSYPSMTSPSSSSKQLPIRMWVRHLSPVESWLFLSILPTSWFDWYMKMHPRAAVTTIAGGGGDGSTNNRQRQQQGQRSDELLLVQVAGIVDAMPQSSSSSSSFSSSTPWLTGTEWIQKNLLEKQQTLLTCQLLERKRLSKRRFYDLYPAVDNVIEEEEVNDEDLDIAIVKVYFRQPNASFQLFSTDLAHYMVRNGIANPKSSSSSDEATAETEISSTRSSSTGVMASDDDDEKIKQRQRQRRLSQEQVSYQKILQLAEMDAAKESRGMWSDPIIRQERRHVMDEVEFQTTASTWQKIWRWIQQTWRQRQRRRQQVKEPMRSFKNEK